MSQAAPAYRERFADDLAKKLPRVPSAPEFHAFAATGGRLAELHLDYENSEEWPLEVVLAQPGMLHLPQCGDLPGDAATGAAHRTGACPRQSLPSRYTRYVRSSSPIVEHQSPIGEAGMNKSEPSSRVAAASVSRTEADIAVSAMLSPIADAIVVDPQD